MPPANITTKGFIGLWTGGARLEDSLRGTAADHRIVKQDDGTLLVHGQCLAKTDELFSALSAYLNSGRMHYLLRWPGSYSVLAARADQDLTIAVDLAGQFPVYFATSPSGFWFASDASLLARETAAGVDRSAVSGHLLGIVNPVITGRRTLLAGVSRVEAESAVRVDRRYRLQRLDVGIATVETRSLAECADVLRGQLLTAVRLRAEKYPDQPISSDLSGGVDSTSLAFLATAHRSAPLPAVTYQSSAAPVRSDLVRASAAVARSTRFEHHVVMGTAAQAPFQELAESPPTDLPTTADLVFARSRLRFAAASATGSRLHLTGDGGDLLAGPVPAYLADFAMAKDYASLWRHSVSWARLRNRPTALVVRRALRTGSQGPRHALLQTASRLARRSGPRASRRWEDAIAYWDEPGAAAAWLTQRARSSVAEQLQDRADSAIFPAGWRPSDYAVREELAASGPVQRGLRAVAELCGVEMHSPYLDSDIIRTCLSLTAGLRTSPTADKPLFHRALIGLVPATTLNRRTKGDYTADQYVGLRHSARFLRALFQAPITAELGILEPRPLLATLDRGLLGLDIPWPAFTTAVATEIWLRRFHDREIPFAGTVT